MKEIAQASCFSAISSKGDGVGHGTGQDSTELKILYSMLVELSIILCKKLKQSETTMKIRHINGNGTFP